MIEKGLLLTWKTKTRTTTAKKKTKKKTRKPSLPLACDMVTARGVGVGGFRWGWVALFILFDVTIPILIISLEIICENRVEIKSVQKFLLTISGLLFLPISPYST